MTKKITASSKVLTMIAFALLWITQGMFYYLEIASSNNFLSYILLGILCLTVFSLTLYGVKYMPVFIVSLVGIAGLCIVYSIIYGTERLVFLVPIACFAPLLFLINNYAAYEGKEKKSLFKQIGNELFDILPFIVLGLIIYAIIKQPYYFEKGHIYYIFISIAVASLYFFSAIMQKKSDADKKTKAGESRFLFLSAGILIIESCFYCLVYQLLVFSSTVVMLWVLVYLFLYEHKNPVCVNTTESVKNKFKKFIDI